MQYLGRMIDSGM